MKCDSWATEVEAYLQKHFGSGAVALFNSSDGILVPASLRPETPERNALAAWCRLRCAGLSERLGRLEGPDA
jgi:hypothetical protein